MAQIDLEDLEPNSHKYKEEQEKEQFEKKPKLKPKVSKKDIVSTKKTLGQKFKDTFIQEDVKTVKKYVMEEVIEPGIKNLILDCLSMFFFKESYNGRRRKYDDDEYTSYGSYYYGGKKKKKKKKKYRDEEEDDYEEEATDYRNIVLKHRSDAEEVVDELRRRIKKYEQASVADLFDLIQISGKYTDNNWGWTDPDDICIRRVSNGYLIDVEEAELLE